MDSDDGLMLNITEFKVEASKHNSKPKQKLNKDEQRRPRKRGFSLVQRNKTVKSIEENVNESYRLKDQSNETRESRTYQNKQVISSLFRYNPEIPKLKSNASSGKSPQRDDHLFSVQKFSDLPLSSYMTSNLENNLKITTLTSVQKLSIPPLIEGKDVFVKSKTGSGKTLCYALPIVHSLQKISPKIERCEGPYALVLVPTRELALQSFNLLQALVKPFQWIVPGLVVGGEKRKSEKARLRKGINILIATPGRLLDHMEKTKCLELKKIKWIVLDEADRLLDMGFEKDVSAILQTVKSHLPANAIFQTVLMSATLNKEIEKLVKTFLHDPKFVNETEMEDMFQSDHTSDNIISDERISTSTTPEQLKQYFVIVPSKMRLATLAAFILWKYQDSNPCKMIVFLSSRDSVDFHHTLFQTNIQKDNLKLFKLHGNMTQIERTDVFKKYSSCPGGVLMCTDVAARGLDLPNVNWIIQYNTPGSAVDYIHRVGRTARIGSEGQAVLFLTPSETGYLETLSEHNIRPEEIHVSEILGTLVNSTDSTKRKGRKKEDSERLYQEAATAHQLKFEEFVLSSEKNTRAAKAAYQSFVRSYSTFPSSLKHIFHIKNLHLGHVAKAFALRDAPRGMFAHGKVRKSKTRKQSIKKKVKRPLPVTEYNGDSITSGPHPKKKRKK